MRNNESLCWIQKLSILLNCSENLRNNAEDSLVALLAQVLDGKYTVFFSDMKPIQSLTRPGCRSIMIRNILTRARFKVMPIRQKAELFFFCYSKRYLTVEEHSNDVERYLLQFEKTLAVEGDMVGVVAAQSISERFTQSALNTFHLSGTKASALTGIKRIIELFDASKTLKLPVVYPLPSSILNKMKETRLQQCCDTIAIRYNYTENYQFSVVISVSPSWRSFTPTICNSLKLYFTSYRKTLKWNMSPDTIVVDFPSSFSLDDMKRLVSLKLPSVHISGCRNCEAVDYNTHGHNGMAIFKPESSMIKNMTWADLFQLDMTVDLTKVVTNDIYFIQEHLGIEAVRNYLCREIMDVLSAEGVYLSERHITIVVDNMTATGSILPNKYSAIDVGESLLLKASFEQATTTLSNAAAQTCVDPLRCTSSCVMVGKTPTMGAMVVETLVPTIHYPPNIPRRDLAINAFRDKFEYLPPLEYFPASPLPAMGDFDDDMPPVEYCPASPLPATGDSDDDLEPPPKKQIKCSIDDLL